MGRPYQVVISPKEKFFLKPEEIRALAKLKEPWALGFLKNYSQIEENYYPNEDDLPRHSKQLIYIAKDIERLEVVDLVVRFWPPKYYVNVDSTLGESVIEPCTLPWKTVYYPENYRYDEDMTDEEINDRRIRAIAP